MASRIVTTSFAIASAAVLLAGCDTISNMFGHNSSQSSGSTGVSSTTSTGSGAPASGTYSSNMDRSAPTATSRSDATGAEMVSADKVKRAQQALKDQGLYKGQVDGVVGPQTREAVAQYQRDHHLNQTSMLDDQTLRSLDSRTSSSR